jgi:hypothetical protein
MRKKNGKVRLMFSMGELTHEGGFGCLFVIWRYREKENGGAHVTVEQ